MRPSLVFRKAILAIVISSNIILTGCGGSDNNDPNPATPKQTTFDVNKSTKCSIKGEAQVKEQTEFNLIAAASDIDGSVASYISS